MPCPRGGVTTGWGVPWVTVWGEPWGGVYRGLPWPVPEVAGGYPGVRDALPRAGPAGVGHRDDPARGRRGEAGASPPSSSSPPVPGPEPVPVPVPVARRGGMAGAGGLWWPWLALRLVATAAFNLDATSTLLKDGDKGSLFGFAVALHRQLSPEPAGW